MSFKTDPWVYHSFRVVLPGDIPTNMWRKLRKPPSPWRRNKQANRYGVHVNFTCSYPASVPLQLDYSWVEQYVTTMLLLVKK